MFIAGRIGALRQTKGISWEVSSEPDWARPLGLQPLVHTEGGCVAHIQGEMKMEMERSSPERHIAPPLAPIGPVSGAGSEQVGEGLEGQHCPGVAVRGAAFAEFEVVEGKGSR